jgi:DNA-binding winged helix-turn-helix (wHTH) protein
LLDPKGVVVDLSTGEYNLLLTFLEAPQRVLTREHLMDSAKHRMATGFDRAIDIQVSRLRRKIDSGEDGQAMIKTIRGTGRGVPNVRRVCRVTGSCALNRRHKHVAVEMIRSARRVSCATVNRSPLGTGARGQSGRPRGGAMARPRRSGQRARARSRCFDEEFGKALRRSHAVGQTHVTVFLSDADDKPIPAKDFKANAIFVIDGKSQRFALTPADGSKLVGTAPAPVRPGVKGAIQLTAPDGASAQAKF